MLPLAYLLRNLLRRRIRTAVTIGGVAATTMLVIAMHAFAEGMTTAATGSAHDDTVVLLGVSAEVDLASVVETTIADHVTQAEAAGIDLGASIANASTRGIDWLIAEALRNLVANALAHTPAGGSVTVSCGVWEGAPFLEVADTGSGIPEADRDRIFGRFYRGSNARGSGSGLGLAIVKEVARVHGASLSIDRGPSGVGTIVQLLFPYTKPPVAEAQAQPAAEPAVSEPPLAAAAAPPLPR